MMQNEKETYEEVDCAHWRGVALLFEDNQVGVFVDDHPHSVPSSGQNAFCKIIMITITSPGQAWKNAKDWQSLPSVSVHMVSGIFVRDGWRKTYCTGDGDGSFLADEDCWEGGWSILAHSLVAVETDS